MNPDSQSGWGQLTQTAGIQSPAQLISDAENPCVLTTFKCIECGRIKQEGNHWFVFSSGNCFVFRPFVPTNKFYDAERLACSESCLLTQATKFIHGEDKK